MFQLQLFLLHCDEWDRVVALPRHKFVTGSTLLQLGAHLPAKLIFYDEFLLMWCNFKFEGVCLTMCVGLQGTIKGPHNFTSTESHFS